MKRFLVLGVFALAAISLAATVTVDTLLKDKAKYDGKEVVVSGKVAEYKARTSRAGNPYITFKLKGASATANVYLRGKLEGDAAPKDGDKVEVSGIYRKEKKVTDTFTSKDEIDASPVAKKKFGVKITERAKG
ncbi:MAG: hypothetical protein JNM28_11415 [Armatimonadetes bacterium]|nr:hypothetical protein [Armatimonadota bacterium]